MEYNARHVGEKNNLVKTIGKFKKMQMFKTLT